LLYAQTIFANNKAVKLVKTWAFSNQQFLTRQLIVLQYYPQWRANTE